MRALTCASDLIPTVGEQWIESNNVGHSICQKSLFYTGMFVCMFVLRSDSYSNPTSELSVTLHCGMC